MPAVDFYLEYCVPTPNDALSVYSTLRSPTTKPNATEPNVYRERVGGGGGGGGKPPFHIKPIVPPAKPSANTHMYHNSPCPLCL